METHFLMQSTVFNVTSGSIDCVDVQVSCKSDGLEEWTTAGGGGGAVILIRCQLSGQGVKTAYKDVSTSIL